jgi:DNA-binding HxlR family transcriptional regulator
MTNAPAKSRNLAPATGCLEAALAVIGNKWTALILRDLNRGARRFCEIEHRSGGINPRTLSQRLDDLAAHGIIEKQQLSDCPARSCYQLTGKGRDLLPVLQQMSAWGAKYYPKS